MGRIGIRVIKRTVGIWPFEERCQLIHYEEPFWRLFTFICVRLPVLVISIHQAIQLVQIQIDSVEVTLQPIFRDICFSCSRTITIIDYRLHSCSHAKCVTLIKLCVRPLSLTHSNTNHKTNSECSGSGLASFMMILVESNIIVLRLARMNVCIVGK